MGRLDDALAGERRARAAAGLAREVRLAGDLTDGAIDFVTNDYLGLARDPGIVAAISSAARAHGAGARAARLLGGGSALDRAAERAAADWLGAEEALLFPSGYQANLALIPALVGREDVVLSDALNHASLIDGARLSRARVLVHDHVDLDHLARLLRASAGARRRLVLTEGVFSMDGDRAPLAAIAALCAEHDAGLVVDEAHSAGVLGPGGAGAWGDEVAEPPPLLARLVTGGKALGVAGAFVVGSAALRTHLVDRARGFVFTTGVAPAIAGGLAAAIARARAADGERARALDLARRFAAGLGLAPPAAAIVPVLVGDDRAALHAAERARVAGFEVRAVRPPTVPAGTARLRVVCHATNDAAQVDALVETLRALDLPRPAPARPSIARPIVVVGTDTGVGKTVASALLVRRLAARGPVAYWKPVQTGTESDTAEVRRLCADVAARFHEPAFEFALPASPHEAAAAEGRSVDLDEVDAQLARHLLEPGTLVVELAGGLHVPWTDGVLQADWLARHRPRVLLVARAGLGTLNHTLLTVEALARRGIVPEELWLVGDRHASNRATLARRTGLPIVEVPRLVAVEAASLAALS